MKRVVVAFAGRIGSGKTTAADYLINIYGFERVKFAGTLKAMSYAFGLNADHIEGHLKEEPCELLGGKTPRYFMQALGTEFGRNLIDPDLWIRAWRHQVDQLPENIPVVVDDCRFPNEADAIYKIGPLTRICRLIRGDEQNNMAHVSELQAFRANHIIENNGTREELDAKVDKITRRLLNMNKNST